MGGAAGRRWPAVQRPLLVTPPKGIVGFQSCLLQRECIIPIQDKPEAFFRIKKKKKKVPCLAGSVWQSEGITVDSGALS